MQRVNASGRQITITNEYNLNRGTIKEPTGEPRPFISKITEYTVPDNKIKTNISGIVNATLDKNGNPEGISSEEKFGYNGVSGITSTSDVPGTTKIRITGLDSNKTSIFNVQNEDSFTFSSGIKGKGGHYFVVPTPDRKLPINQQKRNLQILASNIETERLHKESLLQKPTINAKNSETLSIENLEYVLRNMEFPSKAKEVKSVVIKPSLTEHLTTMALWILKKVK